VFTSGLAARPGLSLLVTSVLSNFLCDAGHSADASTRLDVLNQVVVSHVQALSAYAQSNLTTRIVIVPPLPRSVPDWFSAYLPGLTSLLVGEVLGLSSPQVTCLAPFIAPGSYFDSDGIHLNAAAGVEFIKYIISGVDQSFPVVDCIQLPSSSPDDFTTSSSSEFRSLANAVRELTNVTQKFHADALTRREQDNLVFARLKEDRDYELNKSRENRFTVSGLQLRGDQVPPRDPVQRKEFFRDILQKLVDEACPDVDPKPVVKDVYVNMRHGLGAPFIEGRMDSVESSTAFRIAGAKLAKDEVSSFKGLFIANAVTLSTRVRIEILRSLGTILTTGSQEAFVKGFSSRPVLCVKTKNPELPPTAEPTSSDPGRNYTFCEAIEKWGHRLGQVSLTKAYRKARPAFNGCLEQYFVVLREFETEESDGIFEMLSSSNTHPMGFVPRGYRRGAPRSQPYNPRGPRGYRATRRPYSGGSKRPLAESDVTDSPSKLRK
jgi:hypothetical protein